MVFYSKKKNEGLERLSNDVGFIPKPNFNAKKLVFHSFWNTSMHTHARVCVCMHEAYALKS